MFTKLIRGLLGAFGLIKKTKKFTTENNAAFMRNLEAGQAVLTGAIDANFLQGGIQGATDSFWQHGLLYVGKTAATMVRQMYPELLKNPKIPAEAQEHEIIEAIAEGITVGQLDKNLGDTQQMVGYARPISTVELMKILYRAYRCVGRPYDILEFAGDAMPDGMQDVIPNDPNLFVCSSFLVNAWIPVELLVKKGVDAKRATPKDVNEYLEPNLRWAQTRYNW